MRTSILHIDAVVLACTFPRSFVVDYNQFYSARKSSTDLGKSGDLVQTRGFTFGDNVTHFVTAFSVVACCVLLRTCSFLSHSSLCMSQGGSFCSPVHVEFCENTLHFVTVSACLAWSSLLPRYRRCVDCLYCDLDT